MNKNRTLSLQNHTIERRHIKCDDNIGCSLIKLSKISLIIPVTFHSIFRMTYMMAEI